MNVSHVEFVSVLFRVRRGVEILDTTVSCHLMLVLDDGVGEPSVWRRRATLSNVVRRLRQMPKMVDNTGTNECAPLMIESDAPRVAGSLTE